MNVVFLDIDGVLQPHNSNYRFNADKKIVENLSRKYNIDYFQYDFYDVAAVYYDWDEQSVCRLKGILDETDSKIIISSNWRSKTFPNKMRDLLAIQELEKYYFKDNDFVEGISSFERTRFLEIQKSIYMYNISRFVVLDDWARLLNYFPNNCIITNNEISVDDMHKSIRILKR